MACFHSLASLTIAIACRLHRLMRRPDEREWKCWNFSPAVVHFTNQNWIHKTFYCIRCIMVSKTGFTNWNAKIAILRVSMVVTYYIKLFRTGADRHNGILIPLLLLVAEDNKYRIWHRCFTRPRTNASYIQRTKRAF